MRFFANLFKRESVSEADCFAQAMLEAIRRSGEGRPLAYDRERFQIAPEGKDAIVFNLQDAFAEYSDAPVEARPALMRRFVEAWASVNSTRAPVEYAEARPNLLPALRNARFLDLLSLQAKIDGTAAADLPCEQLNDELIVTLAYQMHGAAQLVTRELLEDWGVTLYEALEAAKQNLSARGAVGFSSSVPGLYVCEANDSYDAARMICNSTFGALEIDGDLVVMVPERDMLLISGTRNEGGLWEMPSLARDGIELGRPVSGVAFRRDGETWAPWLPDGDEFLRIRFESLAVKSKAMNYAEQGALLERLYRHEPRGIAVPELEVEESDLEPPRTTCIWKADAPALLPVADEVVLERGGAFPRVYVPWNKVRDALGERMIPLGLNPERFRVDSFLTADEIGRVAS